MWDAIDKGNDFHGFYESLFADDERPHIMGRVHLTHNYYGSGVVAHELLHAVLDVGFALYSTLDASGDNIIDDPESLCNMMGDLTSQFWRWHYELEEATRGWPTQQRALGSSGVDE